VSMQPSLRSTHSSKYHSRVWPVSSTEATILIPSPTMRCLSFDIFFRAGPNIEWS